MLDVTSFPTLVEDRDPPHMCRGGRCRGTDLLVRLGRQPLALAIAALAIAALAIAVLAIAALMIGALGIGLGHRNMLVNRDHVPITGLLGP